MGWQRGSRGDFKHFKGGPVRRPCPPEGRDHLAYVGQEAPRRFSGYSTALILLATPTLLASELCIVWWSVLVPPTGNRVLNQIPAGDSRESSREQVMPGNGAPTLPGELVAE